MKKQLRFSFLFHSNKYIEELTRVVISYELYETSQSVRFCLSYDPLKWDSILFKIKHYFNKKTHCWYRYCQWQYMYVPKYYYTWSYNFYDTTFSIELKLRHMINLSYYLSNRFLLTVICCPIYHWLEVSCKVDISLVQSANDIFIYDWLTTSDMLGNKSLVSKTLFRF